LLALAWTALAAFVGGPVSARLSASSTNFEDSSSANAAARTQLERAAGTNPDPAVVALVETGAGISSAGSRTRVQRVATLFARDPAVAGVVDTYNSKAGGLVSPDGRLTVVSAVLKPIPSTSEREVARRIEDTFDQESQVILGGSLIANEQSAEQIEKDLVRAELFALPVLFLLSLFVFRGLIAAALPLVSGIVAILSTFVLLRLVNDATPLSVFAANLVSGLGFGLAIDYSLFVVSRYREELAVVGPGRDALRRTMATAGRTVLFSSLTVALSLAALLVFPQPFLYSMGIGGMLAALFAGATALVVLPAILAALGLRVNAFAPARLRRSAEQSARTSSRFWSGLARFVMRRAGLVAALSTAFLLTLGLPFLGIRFTGVDATQLPAGASAREVSEAFATRFSLDRTAPVYLSITAPSSAGKQLRSLATQIRNLPATAAVDAPQMVGSGAWRIDVYSSQPVLASATKDLVRDIRGLALPFPTLVGGQTASFLDRQSSLSAHLPFAIVVLATATLLVLFAMTGSVVLPVKTFVMNLLTLSATFGVLVLIFQDGRFESVLHYTSQGALESTQPIFLAAVAFALSTDYAVFLLTRIKEAHDAGETNADAVRHGLERTGRIITSAALLFCVAVGALATSKIIFIKELGLGMAIAVLIDATVVRAFLVPSLMQLLGQWNWWAPAPLRGLHARYLDRLETGRADGIQATKERSS
jgi:uncharacterized membrane protein YdfJ with MMPL/SSD domain